MAKYLNSNTRTTTRALILSVALLGFAATAAMADAPAWLANSPMLQQQLGAAPTKVSVKQAAPVKRPPARKRSVKAATPAPAPAPAVRQAADQRSSASISAKKLVEQFSQVGTARQVSRYWIEVDLAQGIAMDPDGLIVIGPNGREYGEVLYPGRYRVADAAALRVARVRSREEALRELAAPGAPINRLGATGAQFELVAPWSCQGGGCVMHYNSSKPRPAGFVAGGGLITVWWN